MMQRHTTPRRPGRRVAADPLRRAIERLGADDLRENADAAGGVDLIEQIAREIDETVLPRTIALVGAAGEVAELAISNRRLVGIKVEAGTPPVGTAKGRAAEGFVRVLSAVNETSRAIRIVLKGRADGFSVEEASCSADDLRRAAALPSGGRGLGAVFTELPGQAEAWLYRETAGAAPQRAGPDDLGTVLELLERDVVAQRSARGPALRASGQRPGCMILPFGDERRILVAEDGEALLLAVADAAGTEALIAAWKATFAG